MSGFSHMISHFRDIFTAVRIFPDHFPFFGFFHNCPDFSRSFPIFRTVSNYPNFSRSFPIFGTIEKEHAELEYLLYYSSRTLNTHSLAMLRGKYALFRFVARNGFARFVRKIAFQKVFAPRGGGGGHPCLRIFGTCTKASLLKKEYNRYQSCLRWISSGRTMSCPLSDWLWKIYNSRKAKTLKRHLFMFLPI